ncbi:hypothetical protein [Burkholderia contaminans]|uniref:hypothetical protein n=1 Tax=Burkholderia contaminans TaxID=488447 RepID=UPI00158BE545|nr:hypothetical protein [Burkholderia contaminans]
MNRTTSHVSAPSTNTASVQVPPWCCSTAAVARDARQSLLQETAQGHRMHAVFVRIADGGRHAVRKRQRLAENRDEHG